MFGKMSFDFIYLQNKIWKHPLIVISISTSLIVISRTKQHKCKCEDKTKSNQPNANKIKTKQNKTSWKHQPIFFLLLHNLNLNNETTQMQMWRVCSNKQIIFICLLFELSLSCCPWSRFKLWTFKQPTFMRCMLGCF